MGERPGRSPVPRSGTSTTRTGAESSICSCRLSWRRKSAFAPGSSSCIDAPSAAGSRKSSTWRTSSSWRRAVGVQSVHDRRVAAHEAVVVAQEPHPGPEARQRRRRLARARLTDDQRGAVGAADRGGVHEQHLGPERPPELPAQRRARLPRRQDRRPGDGHEVARRVAVSGAEHLPRRPLELGHRTAVAPHQAAVRHLGIGTGMRSEADAGGGASHAPTVATGARPRVRGPRTRGAACGRAPRPRTRRARRRRRCAARGSRPPPTVSTCDQSSCVRASTARICSRSSSGPSIDRSDGPRRRRLAAAHGTGRAVPAHPPSIAVKSSLLA